MKVFAGGINGVGKSTVLRRTAEVMDIEYVSGSTALLSHLGFPGDYEKLRALSSDEQDREWAACVEKLLATGRSFLLDAHYLSLVRGKVTHQGGKEWLRRFDVAAIIMAPVGEILERISADERVRDRALFPEGLSESGKLDMLIKYQEATYTDFRTLAWKYDLYSIEIFNGAGDLEKTVSKLVDWLSTIRLRTQG